MSKYRITLDGKTYEMEVELIDDTIPAAAKTKETDAGKPAVPANAVIPPVSAAPETKQQSKAGGAVASPMPGTILRVNVSAGDLIQQGQAVMVLEAMKMENEITAPKTGTITVMHVKQGDSVQGGDILFEIGE